MKISLTKNDLPEIKADILAVMCLKKGDDEKAIATLQSDDGGTELDRALNGRLTKTIEQEKFCGGVGKVQLVYSADLLTARYVLLVGAGDSKKISTEAWRKMGASITAAANKIKASTVAGSFNSETIHKLSGTSRAQAFAEGLLLANYRFDHYQSSAKKPTLTQFIVSCAKRANVIQDGFKRAEILSAAVAAARDLVNHPSNICTPSYIAQAATRMAKEFKLTCKIYTPAQMKKLRMPLVLTVGMGSVNEPRFIHLTYKPKGKSKKRIALVGKGVTFDTGGYNLKPGQSMLNMKDDMGGAATMLGTMQAIAGLKPNVTVDCYIPSAENGVDAAAYKPSDVLTSRAGKTIEIVNTDAEGRLLLADALDYAAERKPDLIIDAATLTGAVKYGLGELYTAVLGNDQTAIDKLISAGKECSEPMWQLPLEQDYLKGFKGGIADLKNCGTSGAGTITAALFLEQFVREIPWIHLDIAESSWTDEVSSYYPTKGGTGSPVRSLCELLMNL